MVTRRNLENCLENGDGKRYNDSNRFATFSPFFLDRLQVGIVFGGS